MATITLTSAQKQIETQRSSVYVKINEYYTATVKNLHSFVEYLNTANDVTDLVIESVGDVSQEFYKAVLQKNLECFANILVCVWLTE